MGVHNVMTADAWESTKKDNEVVILDAFATWCGPCKAIAPKVVQLSEQYSQAHFVKIDVDELPDVSAALEIRAMPSFLIFKGGKEVERVVGANPPALEAAIKKAVAGLEENKTETASPVDAPKAE